MNKILLVGELNPFGAEPGYALYPIPRASSGNRLRLILGLTDRQYLREHDRVNLCTGSFSAKAAVAKALEIHRTGGGVVLLGVKVAKAFRDASAYPDVFQPFSLERVDGVWYLTLPHPSGRNLVWNDPDSGKKAAALYDRLRFVQGLPRIDRAD